MARSYYEEINDRPELATRYDWDESGNIIYLGTNETLGAATTDATWSIIKFTYSGGNLVYKQGPIIGIWDNRTSLEWG